MRPGSNAGSRQDLNDHDRLRDDLALQTAVGKEQAAASSPTLCRFENCADRVAALATQWILVEQFIASFQRVPEELVLDFDATDDLVHGNQDGRHFSAYYDNYCFLLERLRTIGLAGTELARAQVWILRCRLLKVGAVIVRNTRRIRFFLASAFPHQAAFRLAAQRFATG